MTTHSAWGPLARPRLRRGVVIAPADGGRWQVRWDFDEVLFLSGASCGLILPWLVTSLDGKTTIDQLERRATEMGAVVGFREIIDCLRERRFIEDGGVEPGCESRSELADAIGASGGDPDKALQDLAKARLVVLGHSRLAERIATSARVQGFCEIEVRRPDESLSGEAFVVAVETDCTSESLERINARALACRRAWMLVSAWNRRLLVGPIFVPGETACYECYRKRLASHRAHLEAYERLEAWRRTQTAPALPEPVLPAVAELMSAHAALELFHFTTGISQARTVGRVLVCHPLDAELTVETVLKIPWCPLCASVDQIVPA